VHVTVSLSPRDVDILREALALWAEQEVPKMVESEIRELHKLEKVLYGAREVLDLKRLVAIKEIFLVGLRGEGD